MFEVALAEDKSTAKEGYDNRTAAYHRHHGNHGVGVVKRMVVAEVGA